MNEIIDATHPSPRHTPTRRMTRASIALDASALRASCASARARERWTTTRAGTTTRATSSSGRYDGRGSLASVSASGRARVVATVVETSRSGGVGRSRRSRRLGRRRGRERGVARALDAAAASAGVRAAVLDGHSAWWAVASPLFALSVGPYLVFLKRLNDAESATGEMRRAFATLLLFVLVSIPAEAYTKSAYGEVLSNIDALHFLIQSAISLTNLRILLAFRDVNTEREDETSTRVDAGRPGKVVEAFAGVGLLATALLLSLDARLLVVPDGSPAALATSVEALRSWADDFESATSAFIGLPSPPARALSVPTWGVHIFSLVEWLLAMGLVWNYADAERGNHRGWRTLTWGMLPLHASGICACTQHFFGNAATLDWLVAAQGAFTMMGNIGMCVAAGELSNDEASTTMSTTSSSREVDAGKLAVEGAVIVDEAESSWWDFDVENFGTKLWAEDDDGVFITKVALLSLAVASGVRGMSLSLSPAFDPTDGAWREYTNVVAFTMVALPLTLNVEKWKNRERVVLARNALSAVYASVVEETGARANEELTKRTERATVAREDNY